jgi:hypothetical protein
VQPTRAGTEEEDDDQPRKKPAKAKTEIWPSTLPEQIKRLRGMQGELSRPAMTQELSQRFLKPHRSRKISDLDDKVEELLETLVAVGRVTEDGRFCALRGRHLCDRRLVPAGRSLESYRRSPFILCLVWVSPGSARRNPNQVGSALGCCSRSVSAPLGRAQWSRGKALRCAPRRMEWAAAWKGLESVPLRDG